MPIVRYPPETVEDAVEYLQDNLAYNQELELLTASKENLDDLYYSLGAYAAGMLGLWSGNEMLLGSCRLAAGNRELDANEASMLIIGRLWEKMHVLEGQP
jgi:hypothetical protein